MPKILDRLVKQLKDKGVKNPYPIAVSQLQKSWNLKKGSMKATSKWTKRWNMTPWQRAIDRASKKSWHPKSRYKYNKSTNLATLKKNKAKKKAKK